MDDERGAWGPTEGDLSAPANDDAGLTRRERRAREDARRAALASAEEARAEPNPEPQPEAFAEPDEVSPGVADVGHEPESQPGSDPEAPAELEAEPESAQASASEPEPEPEPEPGRQPTPPRLPAFPPAGTVFGPDLTMELPPMLPVEQDVDDVRWDGPVPPVGHVPRAPRWPGAPVGESVNDLRPYGNGLGSPRAGEHAGRSTDDEDQARPEAPADEVDADEADPVTPDDGGDVENLGSAPRQGEADQATPPRGLAVPAAPGPVPAASQHEELPTLDDLLATRRRPPAGPAELGWQATVRRLTGGLIAPGPGAAEQQHRRAVATVQRSLDGPKTIVVINPKGGAHKTTASLLIAATFGTHRGGYTLAWDNNETRGTLGWRSQQAHHHNTAVNLLQDLERFGDPGSARVGDLDNYVRAQSARFDVLASDEDAASAASIDAFAFRALHRTLSRFYRVMVVDTGNNMRASNWQAAVEAADQVVIVSTVREDTAQSAAWAVDALRATGHEDTVRKAVTVLAAPAERRDDALSDRLHTHFGRLTRTVLDVPYDPALVSGGPLDYDALAGATREAWLQVTAAVADGL